ncbi:MAG: alpha/beta fold hydrolase [Pseudomonadota bacterium]
MPGTAIVFLPGFMCDYRLFSAQTRALMADGFDCRYGDITNGLSLKSIAKSILRKAPKRFACVGLSMGGLIALELYKQAPERISHLALLNTTARADAAGEARKNQLKRVASGNLDLVLREELKPQYLHPENHTAERLRLLETMGRDLGAHVFCSQTMALSTRESYLDDLPSIACPTLVVGGAEDTVCPPDRHIEISSCIDNADLRILEKCGHLSVLEQPERVTEALINLLDKPGARLTRTGNVALKIV